MKRIMSLVCVLGMFTFIVPQVSAIMITNVPTKNVAIIEQQSDNNPSIAAHPKRKQASTRYYEPTTQDNIAAHPKRKQASKRYCEPISI